MLRQRAAKVWLRIGKRMYVFRKGGQYMNKISGYGNYQSNFYENAVQNRKENIKGTNTAKEEKTKNNTSVNLSKKAQTLLKELKRKYGNMDFMIADFETDEEAAAYMSRGTKEYSVLIDPETLEEMAADDKVKDKYLSIIDEATGELDDIKDQLEEDGSEVTRVGISIGKDGTVSYFAELEKSSAKQQERLEKVREEKKAEKREKAKEQEKARGTKEPNDFYDKTKRTMVTASSAEELLEKIKQVDWDKIAEEKSGSRIDYSI